MSIRLPRGRRLLTVSSALVALAAVPAPPSAGQDIVMRAAPAAGGVAKAGRWAPVLVTIDSRGPSFGGELLVTWGDARARRAVALPSPGRRQFSFHLRTPDPEAAIRVRLAAGGRELQRLDVPVRVLDAVEPVALCVTSTAGIAPGAACTATTTPDLLPRSPRGYDAIDRVVWPEGEQRLSEEQRAAFDRWQAIRALEASGDLGLSPRPTRPVLRRGLPAVAARTIGALGAAYLTALGLVGLIAVRRRISLRPLWLSLAAGVTLAGGAVHAVGRVGPAAGITVHHESVLQQIPGTDASLLSMRGIVEFPSFDGFLLRLPLGDGSIEPALPAGRPEEIGDENGFPVIRGTYGLGARQAFAAEAIVDLQPLAVTRVGSTWTLVNRSAFTLRGCRFADGFSAADVGSLAPGASSSARQISQVLGPLFTCTLDGPFVALNSPGRDVGMRGATIVSTYAGPADAAGREAGR